MAKRLAIEWDARELRLVAGTVRGNAVTISDAACIPIESTEPEALGETLRELLAQRGLEKSSAAIALGRGKAELRELKLPPVPDEELPDVVRFQAVRTFAGAGERAVIDFLPTRRDEEGIRVIAAAVAPEELKKCALVGAPAQLNVENVALAPLAAAALYRHSGQDLTGETVLIDLTAEDADIVVLRDGNPAFVRSIRLADEPAVRIRTLTGEVRRSLMACQEGLGAEESERRVVLWGRAEVHRDEVAALSEALGTSVTTLDPFSLVAIASSLDGRMPEHVGRLAPLVGLLDSVARQGDDLIDFLNPRKAPEPVNHRGRQIAAAAAVLGLVGLVLFVGWRRLQTLDNEIASQEAALAALADDVEMADEAIARTAKVDAFLDGNVLWLDELRRVAVNMPPAENAILDSFAARVGRNGGGTLVITGGVTDSTTIANLETALRDEEHRVVGKGLGRVANNAPYDWEFSETIEVDPALVRRSRDLAAAQASPAPAADAPAPSETTAPAETATPRDARHSGVEVIQDSTAAPAKDGATEEDATEEGSSGEATSEDRGTAGDPAPRGEGVAPGATAPAEQAAPREEGSPSADEATAEPESPLLDPNEISASETDGFNQRSDSLANEPRDDGSTVTMAETTTPEDVQ